MKQEKLEQIIKENKCHWKTILDNPESTTAEDVRDYHGYTPLRICLDNCGGFDPECPNYRRAIKYEGKK